MSILLAVTQAAACTYVLIACVLILNRMSHQTRKVIMLPFIAFTVGAAMGAALAADNKGSFTVCVLAVGLAVFLAINGRARNVT